MKKYLLWLLVPLLVLLLAGCDQLGTTEEPGSNLKRIYVGPEKVDCEGEGPQTCYLVREDPAEQWSLYYFEIDGFDFEPGYEYELIVSENSVQNPPAGGSSITWTLDEVVNKTAVSASESTETADPAASEPPTVEAQPSAEAPAETEFVPIAVEEMGITTVAPEDWPKIEGDPLLKNAWGSGQYRFVAFHSVAGEDVQQAMATLLSTTVEELAGGSVEGEYWEDEIGARSWTMYAIENPDVGLVQTVSMTGQDGTIYIVSLFIETDQKDMVLQPVLENFALDSDPDSGEAGVTEAEAGEAGAGDAGVTEAETSGTETEVRDSTAPADFVDTNWVLNAYDDGSGQLVNVMPEVEITALFAANGRATGLAGCNNYVSLYSLEENYLNVSIPAMTRKECVEPEGIMLLETAYLGDLTRAVSYQIEGTELQLFDGDGRVLLTYQAS